MITILYDNLKFVFTIFALTSIYAYLLNLYALSRYSFILGSIAFYFLLSTLTAVFQKISHIIYNRERVLVIAENAKDAQIIIDKMKCEEKRLNISLSGWTTPQDIADKEVFLSSSSVLISNMIDEKNKFDILVLCSKYNKYVYIIPSFYDISFSNYTLVKFYDTPSFQIENSGLTFQQKLLKRIFDVIFSSLTLIIISPILLIISILIKLDSKGPIFYVQDRITYNGKVYKVFKFRTMIPDAEKIYGAYQSSEDDPRVTTLGKLLRNTHMDELPQFLNVILGSMSVVGPRSDRTNTIDIMNEKATGYDYRLKVKSGITGMAQLFGKYNSDPEDKLRYDIYYIKNYSLLFDMQLIFLTVLSIFKWKGSKNILKSGSDYYLAGKE